MSQLWKSIKLFKKMLLNSMKELKCILNERFLWKHFLHSFPCSRTNKVWGKTTLKYLRKMCFSAPFRIISDRCYFIYILMEITLFEITLFSNNLFLCKKMISIFKRNSQRSKTTLYFRKGKNFSSIVKCEIQIVVHKK